MKPRYKRMLTGMKSGKQESWFVYILACSDGSFYTGITKDLDRRLKEHNAGTASRYTRTRCPVRLVYQEPCGCRKDALIRECAVKALRRKQKEELVNKLT